MVNERRVSIVLVVLAWLPSFACASAGTVPSTGSKPPNAVTASQPPRDQADAQSQVEAQPVKVEITNLPKSETRPTFETRDAIAVVSAVIAACAICFTVWQAKQLAARGRADTFRTLRTSYASLRKELRTAVSSNWASLQISGVTKFADIEDLARYWHHGFDEWYLTKKQRPMSYGPLWTDYYNPVLKKAAQNEVLLVALFRAFSACDTDTDNEFVQEIWTLTGKGSDYADALADRWNKLPAQSHRVTVPPVIKQYFWRTV